MNGCCGSILSIQDGTIILTESDGTIYHFDNYSLVNNNSVILSNATTTKRITSSELLKPKDLRRFFQEYSQEITKCQNGETVEKFSISLEVFNDNFPSSFTNCTSSVYLDVILSKTIDITDWRPNGLCEGAVVRFRKLNGIGKIIWNDKGITYDFLDRVGEILTLKWSNKSFFII